MDTRELLEKVKNGTVSVEEAERYLGRKPFDDLGFAKLDTHRETRSGFPEVIFCDGKNDGFLVSIYKKVYESEGEVFGTRASVHQFEIIQEAFPGIESEKVSGISSAGWPGETAGDTAPKLIYDEVSRILKIEKPGRRKIGNIVVCTAGTADIPVAEEAAQTAEYFGSYVNRIYDVGVSGLHRLLARVDTIQKANAVIAVAGMEGALASVIGGLVRNPVIAVPTSVGYGASMHGLSALLTMINSCANGIAVVNIDNGYGAGYIATQINRLAAR